jgi:hypothetical protein
MSKKIKFGKISIVVFLTALIWVWADLAEDERLSWSKAVTVRVARATDPNLWVSLTVDESVLRPSLLMDAVDLKGPASRVAEVERMRNKGALDLDIFLVPEQMGLTEPGVRTLDALSLLKQSEEIRQLGLTVEACEPRVLTVQVRRLSLEDIAVECVDENGGSVNIESLEPSRVQIRVPSDSVYVARIRLTAEERRQAREAPIEKTAFIDLPDGQRSEAAQKVKIKLAPAEDVLKSYSVSATLGFCMSQNLQGKYKVELREDPTGNPVLIKATPLAYQAYRDSDFHMVLYINDLDRQATDFISRQVVLSFPEEYVRRDEIEADQSPPGVQFRLVPTATETPGPSGL